MFVFILSYENCKKSDHYSYQIIMIIYRLF